MEPLPTVQIPENEAVATVIETKNEFPTKETNSKLSADSKKKAVVDFKPKNELKYQKTLKEEPAISTTMKPERTTQITTEMATEMATEMVTEMVTEIVMETTTNQDFETTTEELEMVTMDEKMSENNATNGIPILVQGVPNLVPIVDLVQSTEIPSKSEMSTTEISTTEEEMMTTMESTSSRARALNISAPEPTNSLHANLTDLSDVSMDDDDKEVEGVPF